MYRNMHSSLFPLNVNKSYILVESPPQLWNSWLHAFLWRPFHLTAAPKRSWFLPRNELARLCSNSLKAHIMYLLCQRIFRPRWRRTPRVRSRVSGYEMFRQQKCILLRCSGFAKELSLSSKGQKFLPLLLLFCANVRISAPEILIAMDAG